MSDLRTGPQPTWFDSHCHLQLLDDPQAAIARAETTGVGRILVIGTDLESSRAAIDLASYDTRISATAGLHPHDASELAAEGVPIETMLHADEVVAVGEAGLDYHYEHSPRGEQETAFRWQIRLAHRFGLPLVVHSRDAWDDTFRILDDEGVPERVVFHCFTGGPDEARRALERGAFVSFSGIVSFADADADAVRAAAAVVPEGRLLVETDAPYLAPVPHRGKPNEPAFVPEVGAAVAAARGTSIDAVRAATAGNAAVLFPRALGERATTR